MSIAIGPDTRRPHHHSTMGFRNPAGTPPRARHRHRLLKFLWRQGVIHASKPVLPPGHVLPRAEVEAGMNRMRATATDSLTWLGHAAFLLRMAGKTILIDPFLSDFASPVPGMGPRRFAPPALTVDQLPRIDVLLVSHNHYDHLDARTIEALPNKAEIAVVVPLGLGRFFRQRGFVRVTELDWHQGHNVEGSRASADWLRVTAVPAIHRSARSFTDRNRTLWAGFILEAAEGANGVQRIYFGGDTGYGAIFRDTGRRYGPFDLAILGIGCYAPKAAMRLNHADPEEAVQIARDLGAERVMGMHWGAIAMTTEPPFEPPVRFLKAAAEAGYAPEDAWILAVGETRALPMAEAMQLRRAG